ncbi:hypothetical protein [Streptomyces telluris]|uniref:Uncharacterized protein n=1 Tax=Streptomyces telluris TaxID=2720021 RepID=A0A9X2RS78_9ACTN|nr:hypothetical protein [Streptomyces telluris]MCQ8774316.1 hypothetical protein [Streptomyces telluris]NJP81428.1 hypothetical protein [Streptomyces telluris]
MSKPAENEKFDCEAGPQGFTATAHRDSNGRRRVTVKGTCSCRTPGYVLILEIASPGVVDTPYELHLNLGEKEPGGTVAQVITPTDVEGTFDITDEVERVVIRNRGFEVPVKDE